MLMRNGFFSEHWLDANQKPAGGVSSGRGFAISWQNGPLGRGEDRREPNGAFVEDVAMTVVDRLEFYQSTEFACEENARAIHLIKEALEILDSRTKDREARGVEGIHEK